MTVAPFRLVKELTAQVGSEAVNSFHFLSLSLKYFNNKSAKAINDVIINNSSVNVMYFILSPPLRKVKGDKKRSAPFYERKGKQPPSVCDALRHAFQRATILYNKRRKKSMLFVLSSVFSALAFLFAPEVCREGCDSEEACIVHKSGRRNASFANYNRYKQ